MREPSALFPPRFLTPSSVELSKDGEDFFFEEKSKFLLVAFIVNIGVRKLGIYASIHII